MNYHQSYVFLQDRLNSFHRWFNLSNFHPGVSQQFDGVCHRHSQILKTKEEFFLHILSVLSKIRHSSLLPSSHSCFWIVRNLFILPEQFKSVLSLLSGVNQFRLIHFQLSARILQILPVLRSSDL